MSEYPMPPAGAVPPAEPVPPIATMRPREESKGAARTPEEIERDIENTRNRMSRDIDEVGERLRPGNIAQDAMSNVGHRARRTRRQLADFVRENSLAVAALGLGTTWFLTQRTRSPVSGDRMARYAYRGPERRSRVDELGAEASEHADNLGSRARERAEELGSRTRERMEDLGTRARSRVGDLGSRARNRTHRMRTGMERQLHDNPLAMLAGATLAGLAVGLAIPETRRERETLGPLRDRMADRAGSAVERAKETAKDVVGETGQELKESAGRVARDAIEGAKNPRG